MEIYSRGSIVLSLAGRDSGRLFVILELRDNYALIADGRFHRIEKPKLKKLKHLSVKAADNIGEKPTNAELRRLTEKYNINLNEKEE